MSTATGERYLEQVHAVVTGGSRGIGAAIAEALLRRGASVTIMARDVAALDARVMALRHSGATVAGVECDVANEQSVDDAFARAVDVLGAPGILVNGAGVAESAPFGQTTRASWHRTIGVNLTGTFLCTAAVMPAMLGAGWGRVVNIASTAGLRGYKTMTAYSASKHGVVGFTRALALETARHGVTVNAVCPGYTDTDMSDRAIANLVASLGKSPDEARAMLLKSIPRGQLTTPAEVAGAVAWLCSPAAAAVTGIAMPVAGGEIG
ncbi:MAG TPA: SDR family NAD(P)-dependent oxidoreductase [Gemmatimonadaceae bacterium]|nr:SDR family NAD(P)-dependent oxidoreductase [Gemmatimonadaceae bacterium]